MKMVHLDAKTIGDDIDLSYFSDLGEIIICPNTPQENIESAICDADVIIVNKLKLNKDNLKFAKNLKLICETATGYDNIDIDYCKQNNIAVCNVVGYSSHNVAQLTIAMALNLTMKLNEFNEYVDNGSYTKSGIANKLSPTYHEMYGKVWGVVGLGAIGKQVANVATALGCDVLAFKRNSDPDYNCVSLEEIFEKSDIISLHLPLSDSTKGLIDKNLISKMKKDAIFINVARGAITNEAALADAILNDKIGGIGIDVYSQEPFSENHPFYKLLGNKKTYLTPHMAWGSYEARKRCMDEVYENIVSFFNGKIRNRLDLQ